MSPLQTGPFAFVHGEAVTVIQEFNTNQCTPPPVPDTPTLSAASQVAWNCQTLHQLEK